MERVICLLIGYVFGTFQTAVIYGKLKGVDIRKMGSGNAGTTNTLRVLGTKAGFIVLFGDMLKCILAVVIVNVIFGKTHPEMIYLLKIYAAAGCVLGHDFPLMLKFKGGKGIACTAGYMCAMHWSFIPMFVSVFLIIFNITHYVSLGSLSIYVGFMIQLIIEGQLGLYGMSQAHLLEMYFIAALMTILAFYQHRTNIQKLLEHNERKTYIFKKNKL
ncbi:MAG: glycerol-3-phosphate 1-O-acyltransferase PlsY [Butyrivibrio sp.]|nr:glycerol-3-phosphate 1-O-acyltransferase PlsY [Butyrivibrio sp.]